VHGDAEILLGGESRSVEALRGGSSESEEEEDEEESGGTAWAKLLVQWAVLHKVVFYVAARDTKNSIWNETAAVAQVALHK